MKKLPFDKNILTTCSEQWLIDQITTVGIILGVIVLFGLGGYGLIIMFFTYLEKRPKSRKKDK